MRLGTAVIVLPWQHADQIAAELEALPAVGIRHVLLHAAEPARQSIRRFSAEIMPAFTAPR